MNALVFHLQVLNSITGEVRRCKRTRTAVEIWKQRDSVYVWMVVEAVKETFDFDAEGLGDVEAVSESIYTCRHFIIVVS